MVSVPLLVKLPAVVKFAPLLIVKLLLLAIVFRFVSAFVLFVVLKISAAAFDGLAKEAPELATPFLLAIGKTLSARIRAGNKRHSDFVRFTS